MKRCGSASLPASTSIGETASTNSRSTASRAVAGNGIHSHTSSVAKASTVAQCGSTARLNCVRPGVMSLVERGAALVGRGIRGIGDTSSCLRVNKSEFGFGFSGKNRHTFLLIGSLQCCACAVGGAATGLRTNQCGVTPCLKIDITD